MDQDEEVQYTKRTCAESACEVSPIPSAPAEFGRIESKYEGDDRHKENLDRPCQRRVVVLLFHPIKHATTPKAGCSGNWEVFFKSVFLIPQVNSFLAVLVVAYWGVRAAVGETAADLGSWFLAH
jgi:hypothetical protein